MKKLKKLFLTKFLKKTKIQKYSIMEENKIETQSNSEQISLASSDSTINPQTVTKSNFGGIAGFGGVFGTGNEGIDICGNGFRTGSETLTTKIRTQRSNPPTYSFSTNVVSTPNSGLGSWIIHDKSMARFSDRMKTYSLWPKQISQRPHQLCQAGFFYTGEGDKVRCFWCGIGLNNWNFTDTILSEHKRHAPYCRYVEMIYM